MKYYKTYFGLDRNLVFSFIDYLKSNNTRKNIQNDSPSNLTQIKIDLNDLFIKGGLQVIYKLNSSYSCFKIRID